MDNAQLIGLSRQVALARNLEVVANNIANMNTTGFKGDNAMFEEFLSLPAREQPDHRRHQTAAELRAGPRRLARLQPRRDASDRQSARCRDRRRRLPCRCSRRTASATPATARCRSHRTASSSPTTACRFWATTGRSRFSPTDRNIAISKDGRVTVNEGATIHGPKAFAASSASCALPNPQQLQKDGTEQFPRARWRDAAAGDDRRPFSNPFIEKSNINGVARNDAADRHHPHLYADRQHAPATKRSATHRHPATRRSSGLIGRRKQYPCAHFTLPPPA